MPHLFIKPMPVVDLKIVSGGQTTPVVWRQLPRSGWWRDLCEVDLEPGATLEMTRNPSSKSEIVADGFAVVPGGYGCFEV